MPRAHKATDTPKTGQDNPHTTHHAATSDPQTEGSSHRMLNGNATGLPSPASR